MEDKAFITKKELHIRWGITAETLRTWLKEDGECQQELLATGYKKTQKKLTQKQLEIIRKHFE